jgi:hypothetical protein
MDMNVLPATSPAEAQALKDKVLALLRMEDGILSEIAKGECDNGEEGEASKGDEVGRDWGRLYSRWGGRKVLSTFGGHAAELGGQGWGVWLKSLEAELGEEVSSYTFNAAMSFDRAPYNTKISDTRLRSAADDTRAHTTGLFLAILLPPTF